jgi:hypothetical protein
MGNHLVLSVRVKVFPYGREARCVQRSVTMRESPVEASIVGKALSEGMIYRRFPISRTAVTRRWFCGNRSKGERSAVQAFRIQQGRARSSKRERQGGLAIKVIIVRMGQSDPFIVVRMSAERRKERRDGQD